MAEETKPPALPVLPTAPVPPTRTSPKIVILYSLPKVGKTNELAKLPGCLLLDAEGGAEIYECLRFRVYSSKDIRDVKKAVLKMGQERARQGMTGDDTFPYKFIAIDTVDKIEEFAEYSATEKYKNSKLNSNHKFEEKYDTITELPEGGGYYYLRNEVIDLINEIGSVCPHLILTCHVKEKKLSGKDEKKGEAVVVNDLSLQGKLAAIVAAKADAIGYMYRSEAKENRGELMISFQTYESAVMGARQKYLAGQKFPFSWARIYPDLFPEEAAKLTAPVEETATT